MCNGSSCFHPFEPTLLKTTISSHRRHFKIPSRNTEVHLHCMYFDKSLLISPFNFFLFVISFNHVSRLDLVLIKVYSFFSLSFFFNYLFYYMISSWSHSSVIFLLLLGLFFFFLATWIVLNCQCSCCLMVLLNFL